MSRPGEFDLIERYFAPLCADSSFGLKDDAAVVVPPLGEQLVVTHDTILQDIHFLADDKPDLIAKKALRVNLSDLFAKGAKPLGYTLSLGLPDRWEERDVSLFAEGLREDGEFYGLSLFGGDTYRSPERVCIGVAMTGAVPDGSYVSRLGANPGEIVAVSGTIGNGALGLDVRRGRLDAGEHKNWLTERYQVPQPLPAYAALVRKFASASMDISDGLLGDLVKLCSASGVSASVDRDSVPLSAAGVMAISMDENWWGRILTGGDDYEVLFTVAPENFPKCLEAARRMDVQITAIGETDDGPAGDVTLLVDGKAVPYASGSYSHF